MSNKNAVLIIILIGIIVYFNSLFNGFVLDDPSQITGNPYIQSINNIPRLFFGSTFAGGIGLEGIYYKPIMTIAYTIIYSLNGPNPFLFHLFQLIIHISSSMLVFILFKRFFEGKLALILAVLFLIHPINEETVVYISNLQDSLFFFFGMLSLIILTKQPPGKFYLLLYPIFLLCSLLSKETGLLFLIIGIFYLLLFYTSSTLIHPLSLTMKLKQYLRPANKKMYRPALIFSSLIVLLIYLMFRAKAVGFNLSSEPIFPMMRISWQQRFITIPEIIFRYLQTFIFPINLAVGQQWVVKNMDIPNFFFPLGVDILCFILIFILILFLTKKKSVLVKTAIFFSIWLILGLGLHSQILPVLDATYADRWFYFSSCGALGLIGIMIQQSKKPQHQQIALIILIVISIIFSLRTVIRNTNWQNGLTLAEHDTKITTDSFVLENNYGSELINIGQYSQAQIHIQKSIDLAPNWWLNWNNLGIVYRHNAVAENNPALITKAEASLTKATQNTSVFNLPYDNLAETLLNFDSASKTVTFIQQTGLKRPLDSKLWFYLSLAEYKLHNINEAVIAANKAYALDPHSTLIIQLHQALKNGQTISIERPDY